MGGQILGGGVLIAVAITLWLVYLMPSVIDRARFNAAERNATRLNQALRVLAETSEVPEEITLELRAKEAREQQRLAKKLREEQERALRAETEFEAELARAESAARIEEAKLDAEIRRRRQRAEHDRQLEERRAALLAAKLDPAVRRRARARARRIARISASAMLVLGVAAVIATFVVPMLTGSVVTAIAGTFATVTGVVMLRRVAVVARRSRTRVSQPSVEATPRLERETAGSRLAELPQIADAEDRGWTPRSLPAPMSVVAGSHAAAVHDVHDAQRALVAAAREEALRVRVIAERPVRIDSHSRPSDAEIEAHVRDLLARRAAS